MLNYAIWYAAALMSSSTVMGAVLPRQVSDGPIVKLPFGTFQGTSSGGVESFLGMPFAHPPVGDLRLRLPLVPPPTTTGITQATAYGPSCIQHGNLAGDLNGVPQSVIDAIQESPVFAVAPIDSEDCLTINVDRPAGIASNASLPIVFWIYGGAFESGSTAMYPHHSLVTRSVDLGTPVIHISANYRLNAYGFLAGREIIEAGVANLGLQDQREALRWIQKYASSFGGDPSKVTIWGESAGACSVGLQMVSSTAQTEDNFRAAFMDSGGVLGVGSGEQPSKQATYDGIVKAVGCSDAKDTLQCLRGVSNVTFRQAMDVPSDQGVRFTYQATSDGVFFTDDPQKLLMAGNYSHIPLITGDCEDEGTLFSFSQTNITTNASFLQWLKDIWMPIASDAEIATMAAAYPDDPAAGSPYNTGPLNEFYGQFKRISSFQGDIWFNAPRRMLLNKLYKVVPTWSYLYKRQKAIPFLGAFHATDLVVETGVYTSSNVPPVDWSYYDALINLAVYLDPNTPAGRAAGVSPLISWPQWSPGGPQLTFVDAESNVQGTALDNPTNLPGEVTSTPPRGLILTMDNFREAAIDTMNSVFLKYPF